MTEHTIGKWMHESDSLDTVEGRMFKTQEALEDAVSTLDTHLDNVWDQREIDQRTRYIANMSAAAITMTNSNIFSQKEGERV